METAAREDEVSDSLREKLRRIQEELKDLGSALVAFSGGVDSSLMLDLAKDVPGGRILAVTAVSETTPTGEVENASRIADLIGVEHLLVESPEMGDADFTANTKEKCYVCKRSRYRLLTELAKARGLACVCDGENADDGTDYRPGRRAAKEFGVRSPLRDAGLTKKEIRAALKGFGRSVWNKPASPCLATRIPYGEAITAEKLRRIDNAEQFLRALVAGDVRVRHCGDSARIEIAPELFPKIVESGARIVAHLRELGFTYVSLDLEGYRTGSLNRVLE